MENNELDDREMCPACRGACGEIEPHEDMLCCGLDSSGCGGKKCTGHDIQYTEDWVPCQLCDGVGKVDRVTAVTYVLEA